MNKYLVKGISEYKYDFEMEVLAESKEDALNMVDDDTVEKIKSVERVPMYNVGDKVIYLSVAKNGLRNELVGTIEEIKEMNEHEWNKDREDKYVYLLNNYEYLRDENEIVRADV